MRVQAGGVLRGRAVRLGDVGDDHGAEEHEHHHAVDRVALAAVAGHAPVREHERRRDDQHEQHLEEVGERRRVLERVRGVDVEEAAAVGAELLDHLLRGDRAHRDRLRQAGDRVRRQVGGEVLDHALGDEHERADHARSASSRRGPCARCPARSCRCSCRCARRSRGSARPPRRCPTPAESQFCTVSPTIWLK